MQSLGLGFYLFAYSLHALQPVGLKHKPRDVLEDPLSCSPHAFFLEMVLLVFTVLGVVEDVPGFGISGKRGNRLACMLSATCSGMDRRCQSVLCIGPSLDSQTLKLLNP